MRIIKGQNRISAVLSKDGLGLNPNQAIAFYPNPTSSSLIVETPKGSYGPEDQIKVFGLQGEQLYAAPLSSFKTYIDLSNYAPGSYLLLMTLDGRKQAPKLPKK